MNFLDVELSVWDDYSSNILWWLNREVLKIYIQWSTLDDQFEAIILWQFHWIFFKEKKKEKDMEMSKGVGESGGLTWEAMREKERM